MSQTVTVRAANPYDFDSAELEEVAQIIRAAASELDVQVMERSERGYGVNAGETLDLLLNTTITSAISIAMPALVAWARARWKHEREEHPELPPRQRSVRIIYGPTGEVLRSVVVDLPDGEPSEENS
ncbi:hypothetical protein [Streptomyces sp. NPDC094031]|uniref:hypothetical protein n=1 Tax=Streptomyces sp. NPDC094031 TaxID=3155307 RepID=UPI003328334B